MSDLVENPVDRFSPDEAHMGILTVSESVSWPVFLVAAALLVLSVYRYND